VRLLFEIVKRVTVLVFVLCAALSASAQRTRWDDLNAKIAELQKSGKNDDALPLAREALQIVESTSGPDDLRTASSLMTLGAIYAAQSRFSDAEPLFQRALSMREKKLGVEHLDVAFSLNALGNLYYGMSRFSDADPLYRRSLAIREKLLGPNDLDVATSLQSLGLACQGEARLGEAEKLYKAALAIREKLLGADDPELGRILNSLGLLYKSEGRFEEAAASYNRAVEIAEKASGPDSLDLAADLSNLGALYRDQGHYAEAEPLVKRSLAMRQKLANPDSALVSQGLNALANLYLRMARYSDAEPLYQRSLEIAEKVYGPDNIDVAHKVANLALLYDDEGRYTESEPLHKRSVAILEKDLGPDHPDIAQALTNMADLYVDLGRYAEAESMLKRAQSIDEKAFGPGHPAVAMALQNLGNVYTDEGRYAEAEKVFDRALEIRYNAFGPDHQDVGNTLSNLARAYSEQGRYTEAEAMLRHALAILEKALGPENPELYVVLLNLGNLNRVNGNYAEAEELYRRCLTITEKGLGGEHPRVAQALNSLAKVYSDQDRYADAEKYCKRSLAIREKNMGSEHPDVAWSLEELAYIYTAQGRYSEAEPLLKRSLAIYEKSLGADSPRVATSQLNLAGLYFALGSTDLAEKYFAVTLANLDRQFKYSFTYMTEKDRLAFLDMVSARYPVFFSFCVANKDRDAQLAGNMYDVLLQQKGLIANSEASLRTLIASGGDKESSSLFDQLSDKRTQLAALATIEPVNRDDWRKTMNKVQQEADSLEKQLVGRSAALAEQKRLQAATWRDVQRTLKKAEAAVEFSRFEYFDGKQWTGKNYYVALIVTSRTRTAPAMIVLPDGDNIERTVVANYRGLSRGLRGVAAVPESGATSQPLGDFYNALWKPLEPALKGIKRIYVAPDGVLNQTALGIVPRRDGRLLMQVYDLRTVSSTRDLLRQKTEAGEMSAVLFGNPRFDLGIEQQQLVAANLAKPVLLSESASNPGVVRGLRSKDLDSKSLEPLPGTKAEIDSVGSLLEQRGWHVDTYSGDQALEEAVKRVQHPRVLHVATHAFFLSDQDAKQLGVADSETSGREDPMLRSGLFFAGADRALHGTAPPAGVDDGILTAYEAAGLNLVGTELVVLSACDTGLGEVKDGEGVFGLQRAFQEAGAQGVLMSLWEVPDRETQELMTRFYRNWLFGQDKQTALRNAQLEMRKIVKARYRADLPYYWGGFVLLGR